MMLVLRTNPGAADIATQIEQTVLALDKGQPLSDVRTMEDMIAERQSPFRIVGQVTLFCIMSARRMLRRSRSSAHL